MSRKSFPRHVSLYLSEEQHRRLRRLVKQSGVDASKHLREALDEYLRCAQRPIVITESYSLRSPNPAHCDHPFQDCDHLFQPIVIAESESL